MVNPQHQTSKSPQITKSETSKQNILVGNVNPLKEFPGSKIHPVFSKIRGQKRYCIHTSKIKLTQVKHIFLNWINTMRQTTIKQHTSQSNNTHSDGLQHFPYQTRVARMAINGLYVCLFRQTQKEDFCLLVSVLFTGSYVVLSIHIRFVGIPSASCQIPKVAYAPGTFTPPPQVSNPDMHHVTCVTHAPWCMRGSLTGGFLWSR